jgi:hypothetical protein
MSEPWQQEECEPSNPPPSRRLVEAPRTRSVRLPWRGLKVYVFWRFGIKVTRPKKAAVTPRPQSVPRLEPKP